MGIPDRADNSVWFIECEIDLLLRSDPLTTNEDCSGGGIHGEALHGDARAIHRDKTLPDQLFTGTARTQSAGSEITLKANFILRAWF